MCSRRDALVCLVTSALAVSVIHGSAQVNDPVLRADREAENEPIPAACLTCHGADMISAQRLSEVAWLREVEKMIGWGATIDNSEKVALAKSLTAQFGVAPAGSAQPPDALVRTCTICHDMRVIEQQRLTLTGWQREIDKMIAWGADLTSSEKLRVAQYLAGRFAPDR